MLAGKYRACGWGLYIFIELQRKEEEKEDERRRETYVMIEWLAFGFVGCGLNVLEARTMSVFVCECVQPPLLISFTQATLQTYSPKSP